MIKIMVEYILIGFFMSVGFAIGAEIDQKIKEELAEYKNIDEYLANGERPPLLVKIADIVNKAFEFCKQVFYKVKSKVVNFFNIFRNRKKEEVLETC